ncbi:TPA: GNAT family N-acetyltransferase, partial [Listeria monocytogenes]|nr:GNAT family N-acetyltransferase [Listeria monocytogenes]
LQNFDNKVDLSLEEQPDLNDINSYYLENGGGFWVALNDEENVIGTIGLMKKDHHCGILKKFFLNPNYRGKKIGVSMQLYNQLINHAKNNEISKIVLDSPSICFRAHSFYKKMGFLNIQKEELPIQYNYPERDSHFFMKIIN